MIIQAVIILLGIFAVVSGFIFFWRSKSPYRWYALCKVAGATYLTIIYAGFIFHEWNDIKKLHQYGNVLDFISLYVRPGAIMFFGWLILDAYLRDWGKKK